MDRVFDVICLGDSTIDIFLSLSEGNNLQDFSFNSGEKYLADGYKLFTGGIASNISVGLSKLGIKTGIISEIGTDILSDKIIQNFSEKGVLTNLIERKPNRTPTLSAIISSKDKHIIFTAHVKSDHKFSFDDVSSSWIIIASLGDEWKEAYDKSLSFAKNKNIKIAFVPGKNQLQAEKNSLSDILKSSEIIIVNKDEAKMLTEESEDIEYLLRELKKYGPKISVITDNTKGSYAIDENSNILHSDAIKVEAKETTGAGDAYATGFLGAYISGKSIEEAMRWGAKNASSVIQKIGAQEGLLSRDKLEEKN